MLRAIQKKEKWAELFFQLITSLSIERKQKYSAEKSLHWIGTFMVN